MVSYEVTLNDGTLERIDDVDAYQQEGQMTTFFRTASGRHVVDSWAVRVASVRTSEVLSVHRRESEMRPTAALRSA